MITNASQVCFSLENKHLVPKIHVHIFFKKKNIYIYVYITVGSKHITEREKKKIEENKQTQMNIKTSNFKKIIRQLYSPTVCGVCH